MFNADFFPTPETVIDIMLDGEPINGKVILEPHVGAGHLVKALVTLGAKEVIGCEKNEELYKIGATYCKMIGRDFLEVTSEQISHVDMIIMNPPFSSGGWHLLHAFKIAPAGCKIIALCNYETLDNPYSKSRQELINLIETYGVYINLGECFTTAERKTEVKVALVKIEKPGSNYQQEFSGFFDTEDEHEQQSNGIMSYNVVRDLVNRYVECVKIFDQQLETAVQLNDMQNGYFDGGKPELSISIGRLGVAIKRNEFKKEMQKNGWKWIFQQLKLEKLSTKGLRDDINKFVEQQENIPFTMRNIYKMIEIVIATTSQRMDKAIIEVFEKVTRHCDENRYGLEGFKTNSHYLMTKKFIFTWGCEKDWNGEKVSLRYDGSTDTLMDMEKALCYITGKNWDTLNPRQDEDNKTVVKEFLPGIWKFRCDNMYMVPGDWYDTHFFKIKGFKKGTIHVEFQDEDVWAKFNQNVARINGYPLPEQKKKTEYQKRQTHERPVEAMV